MHNSLRLSLILSAAGAVLFWANTPTFAAPSARFVFRGGPIYTADPAAPTAEAVAVGDGDILYVGSAAGVELFISKKTQVIDLKGQALFPGFIDAGVNLLRYAESRHQIDLSGARSYEEMLRRISQGARKTPLPTSWVFGSGWNQNEWAAGGEPIRLVNLQSAAGSHPVVLYHAVDDALIANSVVLIIAEIDDGPPDPPGGRFVRTRGGVMTGVLLDEATVLVEQVLPQRTAEESAALLREAADSCAVRGITQVHAMDLSVESVQALDRLAASKEGLPVRVTGILDGRRFSPAQVARLKRKENPRGLFQLPAVGIRVDGGLDTRGAALSSDYEDERGFGGYFVTSPESLVVAVTRLVEAGYQPVLQATGDSAVSVALDALAEVLQTHPDLPGDQGAPRLQSAAVLSQDHLPRLKDLGVSITVQPERVAADHPWIDTRLGVERKVLVHAWKSLAQAGVPVLLSTGAPSGPLDPVRAFHAAVTRQNAAGRPAAGWIAGERLSREEALAGLTRLPAAASPIPNIAGTISVGNRADLTVLSRDIMQVPEKEILSARATLTMVDGRIVHEKMSTP